MVALMGNAVAQQAVLSKGMESKLVDADNIVGGLYLGTYEGLDCWLFTGKRHLKQLVMTDQNLVTLNVVDLPGSNKCDVLAGSIRGNRAAVLVADQSEKRQTVVLAYHLDLDSLTALGPADTVEVFSYDRKDKCMVWGATSPNQQYNAFVGIVQFTEKKQYRTEIRLYDADMNPLWVTEFALGSMYELVVGDDGTVVTLGSEYEEEENHFIFNVVTEKQSNSYDVVVKCDPVYEPHLVGLVGTRAMVMGLFTPTDYANNDTYSGGVVGMAFDVFKATLTGFVLHPYQNEEINILYNKKTKKVQRDQMAEYVKVLGTTTTPYGAAIAVGRRFRTNYVEANGTIKTTFRDMGIHCMAVDTVGQMRWVRNFRRDDRQVGDDDLMHVSLLNRNNDVCLVKSEPTKAPSIYDISNESPKLDMGKKNHLVMYSVNYDGDVNKMVIESKSKHSLLRSIFRSDGSLMLLTARGSKNRLAQLKFTE